MTRLARLALLLVLAALPARADGLAGRLLVATPQLDDPNFARAVVLIVAHDSTGAFGVVVNDQVAERPIAALMRELGLKPQGAKGTVRIFAGGPVEPARGLVLHSAEYKRAGTIAIDDHIALTPDPEILRDMGRGKGPKKALVVFGSAGWAPGQLDAEIAQGGWYSAPADPKLLFDEPAQLRWQDALKRRLQEL
jgi:putative transcriptional regulator